MHGLPICLNTFLYLHTISHFRYENLGDHFEQVGLCLRTHGNSKRLPANSFPAEETSHLAMFIKNYARAHGLPLPGRVPGHRDKVVILPCQVQGSMHCKLVRNRLAEVNSMSSGSQYFHTFLSVHQALTCASCANRTAFPFNMRHVYQRMKR